ncbi:MAG: LysM domain-containing protein [Burkholderiales bacterium]|nr:LysM domain-containing protein [Burkholderiales bacterium]
MPAATTTDLAEGAPDRYVVVQGDTLWSIASRYLKSPWKWGELWRMNQDQIRNPHRIYPGDVLVLDKSAAAVRLSLLKIQTVRLSPQVLASPLAPQPVPTIPLSDIEPFLSKPLVVPPGQLASAPRIVRVQDGRVALGAGDIAYVQTITKEQGDYWHLFRAGPALVDPDTDETLGHEATFLGEAKVAKHGNVTTVEIVKSPREIYAGDYLLPAPPEVGLDNYVPHAPAKKIDARIIAAYGGLFEVGANSIIALSKGARDGLEVGHVLAIYRNLNAAPYQFRESSLWGRTGFIYDAKNPKTRYVNEPLVTRDSPLYGRVGPGGFRHKDDNTGLPSPQLPAERYGLLMIFRVFERASYALIMAADRQVNVLDIATNP